MFPEKPTCHAVDPVFTIAGNIVWREPRIAPIIDPASFPQTDELRKHPFTDDQPFRSCSYCGSIHPQDLLKLLAEGATLGGSDWKYGWPHKFYLEIPNPNPDKLYCVGSGSGGGKPDTYTFSKRAILHGKWYNDHFLDEGFSPEKLAELQTAIEKHAGIKFTLEPQAEPGGRVRLKYEAPHRGYQR